MSYSSEKTVLDSEVCDKDIDRKIDYAWKRLIELFVIAK